MKHPLHTLRRRPLSAWLPATLAALAALSACGGGGGGSPAEPAPPAMPAAVAITGKAVDGALQGATACYDLNDNGACDGSEPASAPSAADGSFRIDVVAAEAGRHRVVVQVPASALDADTGAAVGSAFEMMAPASGVASAHAVFVSPLTTLVQAHIDNTGATLAEATELVRAQAGLALSPLADFTAGTGGAGSTQGADQRQAALVARLLQLLALKQADDLAGVAGTPDRSGRTLSSADVLREIRRNAIASLPAVAGAAADPALAGASGSALQATLQTLARALAAQVGLDAAAVRAGATVAALFTTTAPDTTTEATASLSALRYTDANNWFMRVLQASAADNVADAQGYLRFYDVRSQSSSNAFSANGVVQGWGFGNAQSRAGDLHWNGSAWVGCTLGDRSISKQRDTQGRSDYVYCDRASGGTTTRRLVDISGQAMADVVRDQIRTFPGSANGVSFSTWGPSNLALYGNATFPAGSQLIYQTEVLTQSAPGYDVQASNVVFSYNLAVTTGGDARANPGLACNDPAQNASATVTVTTLEDLIARNPGKPCIFNPGGTAPNVTGNTNEWWGNSTVSLGADLAGVNTLPAGTGNFYSTAARLRVAFSAGNRASFYNCLRRASDGSPRNCSLIGLGSYSIQTLGDARVLSFSVLPALAQRLATARVFVERGGKVYFGYRDPVGGTSTYVRLNITAANEVMLQLGLPRIKPVTAPGTATGARAAALALLKGAWGAFDPAGDSATVLRFGDNGRFFIANADPPLNQTREQSGAELGWFDYDPVTKQISSLLEVDSNLTAGTSHPNRAELQTQYTITATQISSSTGDVIPRLETVTSTTSLIGLWALNSATDLSVPHLAFFSNGRFMLITHSSDPQCQGANQCPPGVEFAQFSYDAQTGLMTLFNPLYDTNGCDGAFESCAAGSQNTTATATVLIAPDGKTAAFSAPDGFTGTIYRIAAQ